MTLVEISESRTPRERIRARVPEWLDLDRLAATVLEDGWWKKAACLGSDLNWFPERGKSSEEQKALCLTCPSLYPCLADQLRTVKKSEDHGIFGGTSERQRQEIRKALKIRRAA